MIEILCLFTPIVLLVVAISSNWRTDVPPSFRRFDCPNNKVPSHRRNVVMKLIGDRVLFGIEHYQMAE